MIKTQQEEVQMSPIHNNLSKRWRYQVSATLQDQDAASLYIDWLFAGHVAAVCTWAERAEVIHLEAPSSSQRTHQVISVYWFKNREDFDRYESHGAPALRSEGIEFAQKLGGIDFERSYGWSWTVRDKT